MVLGTQWNTINVSAIIYVSLAIDATRETDLES